MGKGLEALKVIYDLEDLQGGRDDFWESYRIIEKELKAFEIIIKKFDLPNFIFVNSFIFSKEEFKLLKEVLKDYE